MDDSIREEFPQIFANSGVVYLDNSGKSVLPRSVEEVGIAALRSKSEPWKGIPGEHAEVEQLRDLYRQIVNAESTDNIAMCPSTAFAMTMAANNVVDMGLLAAGRSVLLLELEMASAVYPWQEACRRAGAAMKVVPTPDWLSPGASWARSIIDLIDDSVSVLALPAVHWCDGSLVGLEEIAAHLASLPKERRPLLIVDATQSLGALAMDVQALSIDFLAGSVHKFLLGPYGMSLVYVSSELVPVWKPLDQHERAREGSNLKEWDEVNPFRLPNQGYPLEFLPGARKLDGGGRPHFILVPMLCKSLQLVLDWGVHTIQAYLRKLTDASAERLTKALGDYISILSPSQRCGHILGIRLKSQCYADLSALAQEMKTQHNIHFCVRGSCLRIAPYLYSTPKDFFLFETVFTQLIFRSLPPYPRTKVLIIGASSWLGQFLAQQLAAQPDCLVHGTYTKQAPTWLLADCRHHLDLQDGAQTAQVVGLVQPDVILHLSAWSSPVQCARDPSAALQINRPELLLRYVVDHFPNCRYVFTSTDMVYDGEHAPYAPDHPNALAYPPVNEYGASKLAYERQLLESGLRDLFILRLSNMIGGPFVYRPVGEKFLEFLYKSFLRQTPALKDFEFRSFIDVSAVARLLVELAKGKHGGSVSPILNVGGPRGLSRLELASLLGSAMNVEVKVVHSQGEEEPAPPGHGSIWFVKAMQEDGSTAAVRSPRDITMQTASTETALGYSFPSLEASIREQFLLCHQLLHPHSPPLWQSKG